MSIQAMATGAAPASEPLVRFSHVQKSYDGQSLVVKDLNLDIARGEDVDVFDRAVDVQISRLRRKLHACSDGEIIKTVRGAGYMFDVAVTRP